MFLQNYVKEKENVNNLLVAYRNQGLMTWSINQKRKRKEKNK